jgi:branched-chain amino acid transport system substrate-binding protein
MKKRNWIIVVICLLLVVLILTNKNKIVKSDNKPVVKIGVIAPMTGDNSFWGEGMRNSLILASENIKSDKFNFKLIFEDVKMDPKLTAIATNKLVNVDKVDAIISIFSSPAVIVNSYTVPKNIIHFSMSWDKEPAKAKSTFAHWSIIDKEAKMLAEYMIKKGYKRPAMLTVNHSGFNKGLEILETQFKKYDLEFVGVEKFNFGLRDFKPIIMKLKEKNPDIYLVHCFMPELSIAIKQLRELEINDPITGMEIALYGEVMDLFEGQFFVNPKKPKDEFLKAYKDRFGVDSTLAAPNSYDIYKMLIYAFDKVGSKDNDKVIKVLSEIKDFDGVMDSFDMLENGVVDSPVAIMKIENSQIVEESE